LTYRKAIKIDSAEGKNIQFFEAGEHDLNMIDRKTDFKSLEVVTLDRNKKQRSFVGCQISVRGEIFINEAVEFERDG
jgi:hypothetical protein